MNRKIQDVNFLRNTCVKFNFVKLGMLPANGCLTSCVEEDDSDSERAKRQQFGELRKKTTKMRTRGKKQEKENVKLGLCVAITLTASAG